jgi:hypothetical protein
MANRDDSWRKEKGGDPPLLALLSTLLRADVTNRAT